MLQCKCGVWMRFEQDLARGECMPCFLEAAKQKYADTVGQEISHTTQIGYHGIDLPNGMMALVDDDLPLVLPYKWHARRHNNILNFVIFTVAALLGNRPRSEGAV
jgi:hypothetical protein